jgi:hypothetical protein
VVDVTRGVIKSWLSEASPITDTPSRGASGRVSVLRGDVIPRLSVSWFGSLWIIAVDNSGLSRDTVVFDWGLMHGRDDLSQSHLL